MSTKYYLNWKSHKGVPINVTKLEFVGYGIRFKHDNIAYEEQRWKCKLPNGKRVTLKFREPVGDDSETSHVNNRNPIQDNLPNAIQNTLEEMETGVISEGNPTLAAEIEKHRQLKKLLKDTKDEGCRKYLRMISKPSLKTVNDWRVWVKENPDEHKNFKEILCKLKSMI